MWTITCLWELAYNIALWICMHCCNVHPSQDLWGRMAQIKQTLSATFIKGYFGNFYANRLLSVEKMCGMRKEKWMQTSCSWLESWGQRLFKVITFTVSGLQPALHDVNGNILIDWKYSTKIWNLWKRTDKPLRLILWYREKNTFVVRVTQFNKFSSLL